MMHAASPYSVFTEGSEGLQVNAPHVGGNQETLRTLRTPAIDPVRAHVWEGNQQTLRTLRIRANGDPRAPLATGRPAPCRAVADLPLPPALVAAAVELCQGVPLDVFLSPYPGGFSVAAWAEPSYDIWHVGWRPTLDQRMFEGYVVVNCTQAAS